jgi:hypothetical protein
VQTQASSWYVSVFFCPFFCRTDYKIMAITDARKTFQPYAFGEGISHKDAKHKRDESTGSFWNSPDMAERDSVGVFPATAAAVPSEPPRVALRDSGADSPEDMFRAPSFVFSPQRPTPEPFTDLIPAAKLQRESSIRWSQPAEAEHPISWSEGTSGLFSAAPAAAAAAAVAGVTGIAAVAAAGDVAKNEGQREKERESMTTTASSSQSSGGTVRAAVTSMDSSHLDPFLDSYDETGEGEDPYRRSDLTISARPVSYSSETGSDSFRSAHTSYSATSDDASEMTVDRINAMDFGVIGSGPSRVSRQRDTMDTDVAFAYDGIDGKRTSDPFGN